MSTNIGIVTLLAVGTVAARFAVDVAAVLTALWIWHRWQGARTGA